MRQSIFRKGEELKEKVVYEGSIIGVSYFSFKDLFKSCKDCNGYGFHEENNFVCKTCHGAGKLSEIVNVDLKFNGKYTYLHSCTCMHHALHGGVTDMKNLCSFVLAVYKVLPINTKLFESKIIQPSKDGGF